MSLREQAMAVMLLEQWRQLVEDAQGNVDELLGRTTEFLRSALGDEPAAEARS
jgi:hypothetical protein